MNKLQIRLEGVTINQFTLSDRTTPMRDITSIYLTLSCMRQRNLLAKDDTQETDNMPVEPHKQAIRKNIRTKIQIAHE